MALEQYSKDSFSYAGKNKGPACATYTGTTRAGSDVLIDLCCVSTLLGISADSDVFVCERQRIVVFDMHGAFLRRVGCQWPTEGTVAGLLHVCSDRRPSITVHVHQFGTAFVFSGPTAVLVAVTSGKNKASRSTDALTRESPFMTIGCLLAIPSVPSVTLCRCITG